MAETNWPKPLSDILASRPGAGSHLPVNVNSWERMGSLLLGSGLVLSGVVRGRGLGLAMVLTGAGLVYRATTGHCHLYGALGIDTTTHKPTTAVSPQQGYKVETRITVAQPAEKLFRFWRKLENLPTIMTHLVAVQEIDDRRSHWVAKGPLGSTLEWDAEINNERENELIAWRSLEGSQVDTAGSVHFERQPDTGDTLVRISIKYNPPAGMVGASIASFLGQGLEDQLREDLARFKQIMEAGETPGAEIPKREG